MPRKTQAAPTQKKPELEFLVSCVAGEEGCDQIRKGGIYNAVDLPEAVAMFLREKFKHPDGKPLCILELDKIKARRTSHAGN